MLALTSEVKEERYPVGEHGMWTALDHVAISFCPVFHPGHFALSDGHADIHACLGAFHTFEAFA